MVYTQSRILQFLLHAMLMICACGAAHNMCLQRCSGHVPAIHTCIAHPPAAPQVFALRPDRMMTLNPLTLPLCRWCCDGAQNRQQQQSQQQKALLGEAGATGPSILEQSAVGDSLSIMKFYPMDSNVLWQLCTVAAEETIGLPFQVMELPAFCSRLCLWTALKDGALGIVVAIGCVGP